MGEYSHLKPLAKAMTLTSILQFQNHRQRVKSHPVDQETTAKTDVKQAARKPGNHATSRPVAAIAKASARKHRKQKSNEAQSEYVSTLPPTGTNTRSTVDDSRNQEVSSAAYLQRKLQRTTSVLYPDTAALAGLCRTRSSRRTERSGLLGDSL
jgi:hypothetical protein